MTLVHAETLAPMPFLVKYNILSPPVSCFTEDHLPSQKFLQEAYYLILFQDSVSSCTKGLLNYLRLKITHYILVNNSFIHSEKVIKNSASVDALCFRKIMFEVASCKAGIN